MSYIYSTATKIQALEVLSEGWPDLPARSVFEYGDVLGADLIRRSNSLPFIPKGYILANLPSEEEVARMSDVLNSHGYRVFIENLETPIRDIEEVLEEALS